MTDLERRALARQPLPAAEVEAFYGYAGAGPMLRALCVSHERLRAELEGAEVLYRDAGAEVGKLRERIAAALALTDPGSPAFKAAFPTHPTGGVHAWRVVERIREILLGG